MKFTSEEVDSKGKHLLISKINVYWLNLCSFAPRSSSEVGEDIGAKKP